MKLPHEHGTNIEDITNRMPQIHNFTQAADFFQQLSDVSRLRILWILFHCEECGTNIAAALDMSTAAVSHHLKILKLNDIISSRRDGKEVYYKVIDNEKNRLLHKMMEDLFHIICPNDDCHNHE